MTFLLLSCERNKKQYISEHKNEILFATVSSDSIEADGKSVLTFKAYISKNADRRNVKFSTSSGKFIDSNITFSTDAIIQNDSLVATAYLYSSIDSSSYSFVKISVPQVDTIIHFRSILAYPDEIMLEPIGPVGSIKPDYNSEIQLQATLLRKKGIPTKSQKVLFKTYREDFTEIGDFRAIDKGSDEKGIVKAIFTLKEKTYLGYIFVVAQATGKNQQIITDTLKIFVTN